MISSAAMTICVRRWSAVPEASPARSVIAAVLSSRWSVPCPALILARCPAGLRLTLSTALLSLPYQVSRLNIQSIHRGGVGLMAATYDAIVVGGGHNGLVAAAYLAKSGANTIVLEGRHKTGGAATTEAPWPDAPEFQVTRLSYVMSL